MNREIKFRYFYGIDGKEETYYHVDYTFGEIESHLHIDKDIHTQDLLFKVQYTGLKDKNGEIYESDILKHIGDIEGLDGVFVVKWDKEKCGFFFEHIDPDLKEDHSHWNGIDYETARDYEVIGNIYENPELLK